MNPIVDGSGGHVAPASTVQSVAYGNSASSSSRGEAGRGVEMEEATPLFGGKQNKERNAFGNNQSVLGPGQNDIRDDDLESMCDKEKVAHEIIDHLDVSSSLSIGGDQCPCSDPTPVHRKAVRRRRFNTPWEDVGCSRPSWSMISGL